MPSSCFLRDTINALDARRTARLIGANGEVKCIRRSGGFQLKLYFSRVLFAWNLLDSDRPFRPAGNRARSAQSLRETPFAVLAEMVHDAELAADLALYATAVLQYNSHLGILVFVKAVQHVEHIQDDKLRSD